MMTVKSGKMHTARSGAQGVLGMTATAIVSANSKHPSASRTCPCLPHLLLADIPCNFNSPPALLLHQLHHLVSVNVLIQVHYSHVSTLTCKVDRNSTTDARVATCAQQQADGQDAQPRQSLHQCTVFAAGLPQAGDKPAAAVAVR